jgi:replicative DNA helicase
MIEHELYDHQMEGNVLAGLMVIDRLYDDVSSTLSEDLFYIIRNKCIFHAIKALAEKGSVIDLPLVLDWLKNNKQDEEYGGEDHVNSVHDNSAQSLWNTPTYIKVLADLNTRRKAISALNEALIVIREDRDTPAGEVVAASCAEIIKATDLGLKSDAFIDTKTAINKMEEYIQSGQLDGTPTGFIELDNKIGGMSGSQLIIIGGRPSMGKSLLASNIAENIMRAKKLPALFFSLEMSEIDLTVRLMANQANVDLTTLKSNTRTKEELDRCTLAGVAWSKQPFLIDPTQEIPIDRIRNKSRKIHRKYGGLSVVVVDYIQLVKPSGKKGNRTLEIDEISQSLKALAKELDCPVIGLAQLNRSLENRPNKRPMMSDLRESGGMEQDADVILFVYRDEMYNKEALTAGFAEIIIAKQRQGEVGATVILKFNGSKARFENRVLSQEDFDGGNL